MRCVLQAISLAVCLSEGACLVCPGHIACWGGRLRHPTLYTGPYLCRGAVLKDYGRSVFVFKPYSCLLWAKPIVICLWVSRYAAQ